MINKNKITIPRPSHTRWDTFHLINGQHEKNKIQFGIFYKTISQLLKNMGYSIEHFPSHRSKRITIILNNGKIDFRVRLSLGSDFLTIFNESNPKNKCQFTYKKEYKADIVKNRINNVLNAIIDSTHHINKEVKMGDYLRKMSNVICDYFMSNPPKGFEDAVLQGYPKITSPEPKGKLILKLRESRGHGSMAEFEIKIEDLISVHSPILLGRFQKEEISDQSRCNVKTYLSALEETNKTALLKLNPVFETIIEGKRKFDKTITNQ